MNRKIKVQLKNLGLRYRFIGRSEVRRLHHIIRPNEVIRHCIYGFVNDGPVLFVATEQRLLIVDKRFRFLRSNKIRYDLITNTSLGHGLMGSTLRIRTRTKKIDFKTFADKRLEQLHDFVRSSRREHHERSSLQRIQHGIGQMAVPEQL